MLTSAFYLPQYHPIPENDEWWGAGFTEWRNVVKAQPRFRDHYQPHLPGHLGFYDLRLPEARAAQAELAQTFGIDSFTYYHYWFNGRRLLNRPLDEVLKSGEPSLPFMLCWANENWSRAWDGSDSHLLIGQRYSEADDLAHIRFLAGIFADPRYVRIDGRAVLLVYHAAALPDARRTLEIWRSEAQRLGVGPLWLCRVESRVADRGDPTELGFDAAVEFAPDVLCWGDRVAPGRLLARAQRAAGINRGIRMNMVHSYGSLAENMLAKPLPPYTRYRCVSPGWDNSARRSGGAWIAQGSTPELYGRWLRGVLDQIQAGNAPSELLFINAWNEWAEGNHLEPDLRWGLEYLKATERALRFVQSEGSK